MPEARTYPANLSLESIGQPYLSSGGGPFGTFIRGGGSLLFSDMLGERKLGMTVQFGNHLSDLGLGLQYLNRERRWNWGAVAELQPSIRALPRQRLIEHEGQAAVSIETTLLRADATARGRTPRVSAEPCAAASNSAPASGTPGTGRPCSPPCVRSRTAGCSNERRRPVSAGRPPASARPAWRLSATRRCSERRVPSSAAGIDSR